MRLNDINSRRMKWLNVVCGQKLSFKATVSNLEKYMINEHVGVIYLTAETIE